MADSPPGLQSATESSHKVTSSEDDGKRQEDAPEAPPKKALLSKRLWDATGLNVGMLMTMAKGALPPTIALAMYQATPVAETYLTLGYLVAIESLLSFAILPRAKFIQTMSLNIIGICIGAAIALLVVYCSVQARAHTTRATQPSSGGPSPGAKVAPYNSSASAVSAIWLFFSIYCINTLRASRPQLQFPAVMYSIFTNVAGTYAPQFETMAEGIAFVKRLLETFLTGFGLAAGVSLFVFPMNSRTVTFKQAAGYLGALQKTLKAQADFMKSLENKRVFGGPDTIKGQNGTNGDLKPPFPPNAKEKVKPQTNPEAEELRAAMRAVGELHGKIRGDLTFAKREVAYGKLGAADLDEIYRLFRGMLLPVLGMGSVVDIFERLAERRGWNTSEADASSFDLLDADVTEETKEKEKEQWSEIMKTLHGPFVAMTKSMIGGLQHATFVLELAKPPKKDKVKLSGKETQDTTDVEAQGDLVKPGEAGFANYLSNKIDDFYEQRKSTAKTWCEQRGVDVPANVVGNPAQGDTDLEFESTENSEHQHAQRQLYLILYMEFLLWSTGKAVLDLVLFADRKVEDGTLKKKRLIVPREKLIKKWVKNMLVAEDSTSDHTPDAAEAGRTAIYAGEALQARKDPEHLPAANAWERFGNGIRSISHVLASPESAFGFRVACATLSIGIVAFLGNSQRFFVQQRLVWAMIMVSIGMTTTAGSGVFGFIGRIAGTSVAMCTSLIIWYIVDGKTAGIIPMIWFFMFCEFYFLLKYPRFTIIVLLSMVTQVLIIGYEINTRKIGVKASESSGQPVYPIYELAPYRLACVAGGMAVAFIWTFFPYPITDRSELRKDLGASLYLLANFYSCAHTTVGMRLNGAEGDMNDKNSPGRKLDKARRKVFEKELVLLTGLRQHSAFTAWEPTFGGKFPKKQYDAIIQQVANINNYIALIIYSTRCFSSIAEPSPDQKSWARDFSRVINSINLTSQEVTSMLSLLSAAVTNGNPLPPYLAAPPAFRLSQRLEAMDADILSINHIAEPGYSAFAVMQVASSLISQDLEKLITNIKSLVGVVDFSFHVISTSDSSEDSVLLPDGEKGKKD